MNNAAFYSLLEGAIVYFDLLPQRGNHMECRIILSSSPYVAYSSTSLLHIWGGYRFILFACEFQWFFFFTEEGLRLLL